MPNITYLGAIIIIITMDKQAVLDISNKHYLNALADQVSVVCMKSCAVLSSTSDQLSQQETQCLRILFPLYL